MIRVWGSLNVCFFTWTLRCWRLSLSRSFLHNHVLVAPKLHLLHESLYTGNVQNMYCMPREQDGFPYNIQQNHPTPVSYLKFRQP